MQVLRFSRHNINYYAPNPFWNIFEKVETFLYVLQGEIIVLLLTQKLNSIFINSRNIEKPKEHITTLT